MCDRLYCLSDPDEPGLVRIVVRCDKHRRHAPDICKPGERIDWALEMRDARAALHTLHRTMRRYRKNRGRGVYRCSPRDAREIALRYTARPATGWRLWLNRQIGITGLATLWPGQDAHALAKSDRSIV